MTEAEFRAKYPDSTDEQVALYLAAVEAEKTYVPEPMEVMPVIAVAPKPPPTMTCTTYTAPRGFVCRNIDLDDVPPEVGSDDVAEDLRDILLASKWLSPEQRHRIGTEAMSEADLLAIMVGAPTAAEFAALE